MKEGFWGLPSPAGPRRVKASVFGAPGAFFRDILRASRQVELYDEKFGFEPWRRGVATSVVAAGGLKRRLEKERESFCCLIGYPDLPDGDWNGNSPILLAPGRENFCGRPSPTGTVLVLDPLDMDPSLMAIGQKTPGGLTWYPLVNLLESCFDRGTISVVHLRPRPLPRHDTYPSFVLARLVSRILALALRDRGGS